MANRLSIRDTSMKVGVFLSFAIALGAFLVIGQQGVAHASPGVCETPVVAAFIPGTGFPTGVDPKDPDLGLDQDGEFVSLGNGGMIILEFTSLVDGLGDDIRIVEFQSGTVEKVDVGVSNSIGGPFISIGTAGMAGFISLLDIGLDDDASKIYVKLTDDGDSPSNDTVGFDLDGIEALNCGDSAPPPPPPPEIGDEGCTPGYWKQPQHLDSWVGHDPADDYETVFGVDASFTKTLLGALEQGGGGEKALGRHAVAALLNTASGDVDFAFTTTEVIQMVQNAYASDDFNGAKDLLEAENEMGCPLD